MFEVGYFFGLCKLICLAETSADNGKVVRVTNGSGTRKWTSSIADQKCKFMLPGRDRYTVELGEGEYTTTIDLGYGECIGLHLADGYGFVRYRDLLTLKEIIRTPNLSLKGASAESVKEVDAKLSGLTFAKNAEGEWGYKIGGADPVIPFKSDAIIQSISSRFVVPKDGFIIGTLSAFCRGSSHVEDNPEVYFNGNIMVNGNSVLSISGYKKEYGGIIYDSSSTIHKVRKNDVVTYTINPNGYDHPGGNVRYGAASVFYIH